MLNGYLPIVVLGAGLQGSCIALELAERGIEVLLLDRDDKPMNRASLRNEGKIHLGLVYANDPTLATAELMLQGALHFHNLLTKWLGSKISQLSYSTPFYYLVADNSLLTGEVLANYYAAIEVKYHQLLTQTPKLNYLGKQPERLYRPLTATELATHFQLSRFQGGFQTAELAIDTEQLAMLIRQAINHSPNIQFLPLHQVASVKRSHNNFCIEGIGSDGTWTINAQQVINATWENRLAIDRSVGIEYIDGWLYRLKYRVLAQLPAALQGAPSATMVIGRYGDVVIRPNQTVYLSWYPLALQGWSQDLQPPLSWDAPCRGQVDRNHAEELAASVLKAIDAWFPGIGESKPFLVDAGMIVAQGDTDVIVTCLYLRCSTYHEWCTKLSTCCRLFSHSQWRVLYC